MILFNPYSPIAPGSMKKKRNLDHKFVKTLWKALKNVMKSLVQDFITFFRQYKWVGKNVNISHNARVKANGLQN